jgi:hypothetical protein
VIAAYKTNPKTSICDKTADNLEFITLENKFCGASMSIDKKTPKINAAIIKGEK